MDEMPGMIRPDLQALPQVKDRRASRCCCLDRVHGCPTVPWNLWVTRAWVLSG